MNLRKLFLYACVLYAPLSGSAVITLIPTFATTFSISREFAGLALSAYVIPFAIFQLFSGAIADAFSKNMSLMLSLFLFGTLGFVIAFAPTFEYVLIARFGMGILGSFQIPIVIAIVGEMEFENRGRAFGLLTIFVNLGLAIGPLVSGIFDVLISWQIFFIMIGVFSITNSIILFQTLPSDIKIKEISFKEKFVETVINMRIALNNKQVWIFSISGMLAFTGLVSAYFFLPFYIRDLGFDQFMAGLIVSVAGIAGMIFGLFAGSTIDKFGRKKPLIFGFSLSLVSYLMFVAILIQNFNALLQFILFVPCMALIGIGNAFGFSALSTIANEIIESLKATVSSLSSAFRFIGFALLPVLIPIYEEYGMLFFAMLGTILLILGLISFKSLNTRRTVL